MKRLIGFALGALLMFSCFTGCSVTQDTYTISYGYDGQIYEVEVKPNSLYRIENVPQKTGHDFKGLYDAREGGTRYVDETGISVEAFTLNKNVVLYPQFAPKTYTFMLDYRNGTSNPLTLAVDILYGEEVAGIPLNVTQENKRFIGWFTETEGQGEQITDAKGILAAKKLLNEDNFDLPEDGKINLFAHFEEGNFKVTFRYDDGYSDEERYAINGALVRDIMPKKMVDDQYVLNWSSEPNDTELEHVVISITDDIVLYPCLYGYGITFDTGESEPIPVLVLPAGGNINLPTPTLDGYTFMGWTTEDGSPFTASEMPEENFTLVAQWKKVPPKIVFDVNGGTSVRDITAEAGEPIELPATSREGYAFAGWFREDGSRFSESVMPQENIKLIARWYKRQSVLRTLTNGAQHVNHQKTGILFTIDLSEYIGPNDTTPILFTVSYNLKVKNYTSFLVTPPTWFDFKFYDRNQVNDAYKFGDAVCEWKGEYGTASNKQFSTDLQGNKIYISADSNTWLAGYEITNFSVTMTFTENKLT